MKKTSYRDTAGVLTIEATISMLLFALFLLFFLNFARVYRAQNVVASGAYNAAKDLSVEYFGKTAYADTGIGYITDEIIPFVLNLFGSDNAQSTSVSDWHGDLAGAAKAKFGLAITAQDQTAYSSARADAVLISLGIEDGLDGLDFSGTTVSGDNVQVSISYSVKLMFPFFGISEVDMNQTAVSRLWKFS